MRKGLCLGILLIVIIGVGCGSYYYFFWNSTGKSPADTATSPHSQKRYIQREHIFLENPLTGDDQKVKVFYTTLDAPAIIVVPGGGGSSKNFEHMAVEGAQNFVMITFDPLGRGESEGTETMYGIEDQAFLYELYMFGKEKGNGSLSIATFSYGIAMAAGALATYDMQIDMWIDWEGPHDRTMVTGYCLEDKKGMNALSGEEKNQIRTDMLRRISQGSAPPACADEEYWSEREAVHAIEHIAPSQIEIYVRLQGAHDHVHGRFYAHALEMINTMTAHGITTQLNKAAQNRIYTETSLLPVLLGPINSREMVLDILCTYYYA